MIIDDQVEVTYTDIKVIGNGSFDRCFFSLVIAPISSIHEH